MRQYINCVVPVQDLTDVTYVKRAKQLVATNIKGLLVIPRAWQMDDQIMNALCRMVPCVRRQ